MKSEGLRFSLCSWLHAYWRVLRDFVETRGSDKIRHGNLGDLPTKIRCVHAFYDPKRFDCVLLKHCNRGPFNTSFREALGTKLTLITYKYTKIKGVRCQQAQPVQIGRNGEGPAEVQESTRRQTGKRAARGTRQDSSRERPCKRSELGVRTNIREEKHE